MARLIALSFLALPLIEIALFILVGRAIGLFPTLALVILAAIAGGLLLRQQGLGVLARLRSAGSNVPVIVQTGHGGIETVVEAMRAGAFDFVVKPVAPERLAVARVFFRGNRGWSAGDAVPEALVAVALRELRALTGVRAEPLHAVVSDHERALPQYLVGHRTRVTTLRRRLANWPALALAGAAYDGVGVPDCIASGQRAARAVAAALGLCQTQRPS